MTRTRMAVALVLALAACGRGPESGEDGQLSFRWILVDAPEPHSFDLAIARGFRMDVGVTRGGAPLTVDKATSRDRGLIAVPNVREEGFTVEAERTGNSQVDVSAGGHEDAANFVVVDLKRVALERPAPRGRAPSTNFAFLRGGIALFGMRLLALDDRPLVGWGAAPVTIAPAKAATALVTVMTDHLAVEFTDYGPVAITPLGGASIEGEVVDPAHVTALALAPLDEVKTLSSAAGAPVAHLVLSSTLDDGREGVGLDGIVTVESRTASVCTVLPAPAMGDAVYALRGVGPGSCQLVANIGTLATRATIPIAP